MTAYSAGALYNSTCSVTVVENIELRQPSHAYKHMGIQRASDDFSGCNRSILAYNNTQLIISAYEKVMLTVKARRVNMIPATAFLPRFYIFSAYI